MICKLCLNNYPKLADSHIIPEFEYLRNKIFAKGDGAMFDFQRGKIKKSRKGEYEKLLCLQCESNVNKRYESYALKLFYDGSYPNTNFSWQKLNNLQFGTVLHYSGVNYHKLKSYLLLNLWRSAISSRPFFERISIPEERLESMRVKLLENIPFDENDFAISIHSFEYSQRISPTIIQPATAEDISFFLIGKTFYLYHHNDSKVNDETIFLTPKENGEFSVQIVPEDRASQILNRYHKTDIFNL
ncbi:MAG: hypothetical protein QNK23_16385 [Crocinitomicaceae bacterium]|nr:hypothetical protein [Crocinitomicaceae bacterium]